MKALVFFLLTFLTVNVYSQKKEFIRVYNLEGKKIIYGRDYKITDSTIEFKDKNKIIHYAQIGFIKTKHSFGHNIGVGSLLGVASLSLFSLMPSIQSDLFDKGTMVVLVSTLIGAPSGAFIGTISNIFKNTKRVNINGDIEKWEKFRTSFLRISK
ncbi:MAG: hypothetical protein Q8L07_06250 [Sediminibacterium sp.]|nr:hypothetical protein [Sediminibacterium sp.]